MPPVSQPKKTFSLEDANRTLPLVSRIVGDIVGISRRMAELHRLWEMHREEGRREKVRSIEEQVQELHYEQAGYVDELERIGCELKDPAMGLVDFPAMLGRRVVFLCWKLGEPRISYWHEVDAGFSGRRPVVGYFPSGA
jgi:hypothetical protein